MPKSKSSGAASLKSEPPPLQTIIPPPEGTDPSTVIFPEWVDQELNAEKWDLPKQAPQKANSSQKSNGTELVSYEFVDQHIVTMPSSLEVHEWKIPSAIFPDTNVVMYKEGAGYSNFLYASKHLFHSEFVRSFICSIGILEYLGYVAPWPVEAVGPNYTPNTSGLAWKPWHHVYSMCKAGKGQTHKPQVNGLGKYAVRLYWLGCWRRIMVDHKLPVDQTNHVLLPSVELNEEITLESASATAAPEPDKKGKKKLSGTFTQTEPKVIELWPFILCKALMKVASLTWTADKELVDFDIINSLTGWLVQKVHTTNLSSGEIWDMCAAYSNHYSWPEGNKPPDPQNQKAKKDSKKPEISSKKSDVSGKAETAEVTPYCLIATLADMRDVRTEDMPDIAPCWTHTFLIDQTRNIPLVKPDIQEELARWKRFRWVAWAIRKGIYKENLDQLIKCLKMVSMFRQCADHVVYTLPSKLAIDIKESVRCIDQMAVEAGDKQGKKKDEKETNTPKGSKTPSDKTPKKNATEELVAPPDPSIWADYNTMYQYIENLYIYLRPSQFDTNMKITNLEEKISGKGIKVEKKPKKGEERVQKRMIWPKHLFFNRNEPVYLFADSLDYKYLLINLSHEGNYNIILPDDLRNPFECFGTSSNTQPISHIVVEKYIWQQNEIGDLSLSLNTTGSKSILMLLRPGRTCLRLWVKSDNSFVIIVLSDADISIGSSETVLESLQRESHILTQCSYDIGSCFGKLVQSFGMEDYKECLINFRASYKPQIKIRKVQSSVIDREFEMELINTINEKCLEYRKDIIFALRVLFIDPKFCISNENMSCCGNFSSIDDVVELKLQEIAATKIQALFKMIYAQKLLAYHKTEHKSYLKIFETLKRFYKDIFKVENRVAICNQIMRNLLLMNPTLKDLSKLYSLKDELMSVVHFQYFLGSCNAVANSWALFDRFVFYVHSSQTETVKVVLFCDTIRYIVRVLNNDTNEEMPRISNNVCVCEYPSNTGGYTLLAYGWATDETTKLNWKLVLISLKKWGTSLISVPFKNLVSEHIWDTYKPNVNDAICKCMVVLDKDMFCSFRLTCSTPNVLVHLKCLNVYGLTRAEIIGRGSVILPIVGLKCTQRESDWPLKSIESQVTVLSLKVKHSQQISKKRRSSENSSLKGSIKSSTSKKIKRSTTRSLSAGQKLGKDDKCENFYLIEAYVLKHTWPLTREEWQNAEEAKKRNLIGDMYGELTSKVKYRSRVSFKKELNRERISSEHKTAKLPFWTLQMIYDKADPVQIKIDRRRDEEIKEIKRKWYEASPGRYEMSQKIRQDYLNTNYVTFKDSELQTSVSIFPSVMSGSNVSMIKSLSQGFSEVDFDDPDGRTLIRPISKTKILPPFNYTAHIVPKERSRSFDRLTQEFNLGVIKTEEDEANDELMRAQAIEDFQTRREEHENQLELLIVKNSTDRVEIENWFAECRDETVEMMNTAYAMRDKFIKILIEAEEAKKLATGSPPKGKGKKK